MCGSHTKTHPFHRFSTLTETWKELKVQGIWSEVQELFRCSSNDLRAPRHITQPLSAVFKKSTETPLVPNTEKEYKTQCAMRNKAPSRGSADLNEFFMVISAD